MDIKESINTTTGKPLEEWISIINEQNFVEYDDIVKFLKEEYSIPHMHAHLIAQLRD